MECNKEEALRAMDIAKIKVTENDYNGAKKFANKAQDLYPKLDGLKQVLMLIDVYISAGNKISGGESDWYGILGVDPLADDEVVKKQYKRLALLLHPDKNKCEGAECAFKLVLEAWCVLSDKVKRIAYDQKRKLNEVKPRKSRKQKQPPKQHKQPPNQKQQPPNQQKQPQSQKQQPPNQQKPPPNQKQQPPNQQKPPPNQKQQPPNQKQQPPNQQKPPPNQKQQPPNQQKPPPNQKQQPPNQPKQSPNKQKQPPNQPSSNGVRNVRARSNKPTSKVCTFWTMCNKCSTQYEYIRVYYLNKTVLCRNCRGTFMATEKEKTPTEKEKIPQATNKNTNGTSSCGRDSSLTIGVYSSFRWDFSLSKMGSFNSGNVANHAEERLKREVRESEEKDEEAARGIANSDLEVEERVFKKLRTDDYAEASSGIKV
ncbi:Chaperone protein dnaJ 49 [Cardamine amara subsp. amara]|uniref:Chaperone protein dnaJ 49 n=1 Tax=Cardamine amara subsp. amara TaxID=228776 RepID=A0ABD0ZKD0_CARAN